MNEQVHQDAVDLIPELVKRLKFDIQNQPPNQLPMITQSVIILNGFLIGLGDANFLDMKNVLNDLKSRRNEGKNNGSGTQGK